MSSSLIVTLVAMLVAASTAADASPPVLHSRDSLPQGSDYWVPLNDGGAFQPATDQDASPEKARRLREAQHRFLATEESAVPSFTSYDQQFVDGAETYYDEYAQAWRMLGFYIDCDEVNDDRRRLEGDGDGCQRYLLWAAYVDLDYEGGGIGEYQFWDRNAEVWDTTSCEEHGNGRCAMMDCHEPTTHFSLLGYFKEANYAGEWMEQLFKHEGVCVWTEDEYDLMGDGYDFWDTSCSQTEYTDEEGNYIYYDLKPLPEGNMTMGLYTDYRCVVEYTGESVTVDDALGGDRRKLREGRRANEEDNDVSFDEYIEAWNDAFSIFKTCQPCKAYNLNYDGDGDGGRRLDDANEGYFQCNDEAGYTNVNQCMKFASKTEMETASFNDVEKASQQGTLNAVKVVTGTATTMLSRPVVDVSTSFVFLGISILFFLVGCYMLVRSWKKSTEENNALKEPLVSSDGVVA